MLHAYVREHLIDVGDFVSYPELIDMFDLGETVPVAMAGSVLSGVVAVVNRRLHRDGDHRHLVNVATAGYRVGSPRDLREEAMSRMRAVDRQQIANLRLIEKVIRHPDATAAERKRAADAAAAQAALLTLVRRDQRRIQTMWPSEETSPVPPEEPPPP